MMSVSKVRKILRKLYGPKQYRIKSTGEINVYVKLPNSDVVDWLFFGWLDDDLTEQRLKYFSGEEQE